MKPHSLLLLALMLSFVVFPTVGFATIAPEQKLLLGQNPHNDDGDCSICHVASVEKLKGWFVFPSTKRQLKEDPNTLCRKCHGVSFGHGIGKKPAMNLEGLPLSADGTINCALTCHDMHIKGVDDTNQLRLHLRLPNTKLCTSCHDK